MNEKNFSDVGNAMNFILLPMLRAFVVQNLSKYFGADWWQDGVLDELTEKQKRNLPEIGSYNELTKCLDAQLCLLLLDIHWEEIFSKVLPYSHFNYIKELKTTRNILAHGPELLNDDETDRALSTMILLSKQFDEETANELQKILDKRHGKVEKPKDEEPAEKISVKIPANLKSWRDVIAPRPDVASGNYRQAEFALNLADIVRKRGLAEYIDPVEFFSRTYLTDGLKSLLVETLKRLAGSDGDPVIQLKTSFGGGKSHSLLALYHLFGGIRAEQSDAVREILDAAEISFIPKVHTAVIVGTWENPLKSTLWGEIAAQLSRSTGKPELYEMMQENDKRGISPGVALLQKLFDEAGACLILIDELVAYGRKLSLGEIEGGGSFGNLISFIQELTEAAKSSPKTAVVVSIPESDAEIVDELGLKVLRQVEKVIGRMEFVWTPVSVHEGYEIVRRRLFNQISSQKSREDVCNAFFNMYLSNANDFPYESRSTTYREKLLACYPIHPKFFDYLYDKWTNLDGFQKTRGVLRLMAKVVYELWKNGDKSLLIMPGNIPLNFAPVRDELTKLLGGNWDIIVNSEVDGDHSKPQELDSQNARFGRLQASKKIARSIFIGTAPSSRKGDLLGIEENELHLSTIQPQDLENIAIYNDALTKLKSNSYYLYSQSTRIWFSVNPTLRKMVNEKRDRFSDDDVEFEIEKKLATWHKGRNLFKSVHICPVDTNDIIEEQAGRLVILSPKYIYDDRLKNNPAIEFARKILETRGNIPRKYKNTLLFLAADKSKMDVLKKAVREYKAWSEIKAEADAEQLDLDRSQLKIVDDNIKTTKQTFDMKISQAYCRIFSPDTFGDEDTKNLKWFVEEIECTTENNISVASEKFNRSEKLLDSLGSEKLKNLLDRFIWRDENFVNIKQLWEYFTTYYYMPRLIDVSVLLETVKKGVKTKAFALAKTWQDGECIDLQFGDNFSGQVSLENFLIKKSFAEEKVKPENKEDTAENKQPETPPKIEVEKEILPTYFSMEVELDKTRLNKNFNTYIEEVVSNLIDIPNVEVSVKLNVIVSAPEGIPTNKKEIVSENCNVLKVKNFNFE